MEPATNPPGPVPELKYTWDFFLAHAGPDVELARSLYHVLNPPAKVFLDAEDLVYGDYFPAKLPQALHASLISIILVSPNSGVAYYQKEEIVIAIQKTRADPRTHKVIPVYINAKELSAEQIPYGLNGIHSIYVTDPGNFSEVRDKLLKTLDLMKKYETRKEEVVQKQQIAVNRITAPLSNRDVLSGLHEVTRFVRPLLYSMLGIFIISALLLCCSVFFDQELRGLVITISCSLCALSLTIILWIISQSLKLTPQIAQGNINGG